MYIYIVIWNNPELTNIMKNMPIYIYTEINTALICLIHLMINILNKKKTFSLVGSDSP